MTFGPIKQFQELLDRCDEAYIEFEEYMDSSEMTVEEIFRAGFSKGVFLTLRCDELFEMLSGKYEEKE